MLLLCFYGFVSGLGSLRVLYAAAMSAGYYELMSTLLSTEALIAVGSLNSVGSIELAESDERSFTSLLVKSYVDDGILFVNSCFSICASKVDLLKCLIAISFWSYDMSGSSIEACLFGTDCLCACLSSLTYALFILSTNDLGCLRLLLSQDLYSYRYLIAGGTSVKFSTVYIGSF